MKSFFKAGIILAIAATLSACGLNDSQSKKTAKAVERQQGQYNIAQPIPAYDWSVERDIVIQLYNMRNMKVVTHSVWRGAMSVIEGDCPSMGFSVPYDTSLTNPLVAYKTIKGVISIEQAEPNGIFASKNTSATWVLCVGETGQLDPVYIEAKVTAYPYPVNVNYETNRVTRAGKSSFSIKVK